MILGIIPARAGSTGIKDKNLVSGPRLQGKPLLMYTVEAAVHSKRLDKVAVSSNDLDTLSSMPPKVLAHRREDAISGSDSPTEALLEVAMKIWKPDICVLLQLTSPLRTAEDIDAAIDLLEHDNADSVVSVAPEYGFRWHEGVDGAHSDYDPIHRPMRQKQQLWKENGAIYAFTRNWWEQNHVRCGGKVSLYKMERATGIEIDEPLDLALVSATLAHDKRHLSKVRR